MTNPKSIFADIQKKLKESSNLSGVLSGNFKSENIFKPTKAGTITVRLLWLPPAEDVKRDFPMINTYVHRFYDATATVRKYAKVICPTSQHMDGENAQGFRNCCICDAVSKFYKDSANSPSAREMYNTFHRACECYIPVYIVNGPEELQGQVKILQYGKQFKDFFNRKIFGITTKTDSEPIDTDEIIGLEAFMYYDNDNDEIVTEGYDLIISTTVENITINNNKVKIPKYTLDFSRKPKTIDEINGINLKKATGIKYFKNLNDELGFDKNFLVYSTAEEREAFLKSYVIKDNSKPISNSDINGLINNSSNDDEEEEEEVAPVKKATKKAPQVEEEDDYVDTDDNTSNSKNNGDDGDIDVDALLAGLN
jgi:hypothetical protein